MANENPRLAQRYSWVIDIELTDIESGIRVAGQTRDLSLFGCGMVSVHLFPRGTKVGLKLSRRGVSVSALSRIVYATPELGMGLVFTNIEREDERILEGWIADMIADLSTRSPR